MKNFKMLNLLCMAICCISVVSCIDDESLDGAIKPPTENVEAIDLGLPSGTLWANCNIGAFDPIDYGDYFAWGETSPRNKFTFSDYWYYEISDYGYCSNIGTNIANTKYDAVIEQWGNEWCMPTAEEFEELIKYCTWTWIKYDNSVWGYKVEGKNGNWIFLPASGCCEESSIIDLDVKGGYWSGDIYKNEQDFANALCFNANSCEMDKFARYYGLAIRPVKNKNKCLNEEKVNFTYEVAEQDYKLDYYVVSHIKFNNTSAESGNLKWYFGTSEGNYTADLTDINHPIVKYKKAGLYYVTLTIEGVGSCTYPILINDISPKLSISKQSMELVELYNCKVSFDISLPNPEKKRVKYSWKFPEGALDENGQAITEPIEFITNPETGEVECPQNITFSNLGTQRVAVDAWYDLNDEYRQLEQVYIDIHVASQIPAPTLYYAQVGGNIKAVKLIDESLLPRGTKIFPYDMGVPSGDNSFNLLYGATAEGEHWIYILDAGKQYYYINDDAGVLGDGKITAMRTDGTDVNVVITNVGGAAFNDPFHGCIYDGYIYYSDRNRGVSKIKMTERGLVEEKTSDNFRTNYFVTNERLPYYGSQIAYAAITNGIYCDKNKLWWWGKNYSGNGVMRFVESQIGKDQKEGATKPATYPETLDGLKFTSFVVDQGTKTRKANFIYTWVIGSSNVGSFTGLNQYSLEEATYPKLAATAKPTASVQMAAKPVNTTADEQVHVKQMALHEVDGKVFFGFRADGSDASGIRTGLVYFDPADSKCKPYGEVTDEILGVTINPNPTKLF